MSDAKTRQRWEARRKMIADEFFAGHEAVADAVLDALPYSAIPDWGDVALLMQSLDAAGLLVTTEHDAAVAARELREAADGVRAIFNDPDRTRPLRRDAEVATDFASDPEWAAMVVEDHADRKEREGGATDA